MSINQLYQDERARFKPGNPGGVKGRSGRPIGVTTKASKLREVREELRRMALIDAIPLYSAVRDKAIKTGDEKKAAFCMQFGPLDNGVELELPDVVDSKSALLAYSILLKATAEGVVRLADAKEVMQLLDKFIHADNTVNVQEVLLEIQQHIRSTRGKTDAARPHGVFTVMDGGDDGRE